MEPLTHYAYDIVNVIRYVLSNITEFFSLLFTPLSWLFNFFKGVFAGMTATAPTTAITWTFPDNIMAVFNAIPFFSVLCYACGAGLSILILVFILKKIVNF